jgi:hypothetical protein
MPVFLRRSNPYLQMTREEFIRRFTEHVLVLCSEGKRPFGRSPREYAEGVAATYWIERYPEGLTPERCAEEDAMFWEE